MTMMATIPLTFRLNGEPQACSVPSDTSLSEILRDHMSLSVSKTACNIGRCGACTVLLDDMPVNACLLMAWQIKGREITTPEGLGQIAVARIVKRALGEEAAFQCGYCAPGFIVALTALLRDNRQASEDDIRAGLEGNLCRCTGYHSIIRGALRAVELLQDENLAGRPGEKAP